MESLTKTRILLVDDHALFREGLAGIISSQPDMEVVGEASDGLEAMILAKELVPDLILMDIQMPGQDGLETTRLIKKEMPDVTVVMLTVRADDSKLFQAIKYGAQGYLLKDIRSREMLELLRGAMRGEAALSAHLAGQILDEFRRMSQLVPEKPDELPAILTEREREVLGFVATGKTDKEIADRLSLSIHTVKTHVRNILSKLEVNSRREAARFARTKGLV